jgi:hypothetical protein
MHGMEPYVIHNQIYLSHRLIALVEHRAAVAYFRLSFPVSCS